MMITQSSFLQGAVCGRGQRPKQVNSLTNHAYLRMAINSMRWGEVQSNINLRENGLDAVNRKTHCFVTRGYVCVFNLRKNISLQKLFREECEGLRVCQAVKRITQEFSKIYKRNNLKKDICPTFSYKNYLGRNVRGWGCARQSKESPTSFSGLSIYIFDIVLSRFLSFSSAIANTLFIKQNLLDQSL